MTLTEVNRDLGFCYEYLHILGGEYPIWPVIVYLTETYVTMNTKLADRSMGSTTLYNRGGPSELEHILLFYVTDNAKH
jgi:hypothetical protein